MVFKVICVFAHSFFLFSDRLFIVQKEFQKSTVFQSCSYIDEVYLVDWVYGAKRKPFIQKDFEQFKPLFVVLRYEQILNLAISHTKFIISFLEVIVELEVNDDEVILTIVLIVHRHYVDEVFIHRVFYNLPGFEVKLVGLDQLEVVQGRYHQLILVQA